jgi:hypothetical protein
MINNRERGNIKKMKHIGSLLVFTAAALITLGLSGTALAFHGGGVAACDGCHTMHSSVDGVAQPTPGNSLTKGSDPSSTCLNCHGDVGSGRSSSYHVMSEDGHYFHSGGDFFWVTKTFSWTERNNLVTSKGEDHGHSIVAADYGMIAQAVPATSPGGTYPSDSLGCSSCHDPHGTIINNTGGPISVSGSYGATPDAGTRAGNYRLLADNGYRTAGLSYNTPGGVPKAVSTNSNVTDTLHTDYGSNMSAWCANCHGEFTMAQKHPVGPVDGSLSKTNNTTGQSYAQTYSKYVKTGDSSAAGWPQSAGPYLELVSFERGAGAALATDSITGPTGSSNVMCLTCHRAHASAFDNAGRWDFAAEFIAESHPAAGDNDVGDIIGDPQETAYFGRNIITEYGEYQRSFCNKCHRKD